LILLLFAGGLSLRSHSADLEQLGNVRFPASTSEIAQEHFETGVAYLHSFGWIQARREFRRAQQLDPGFAMAYWGEALSYNHPLYPMRDTDSPQQALNRLAPSADARNAKAPTALEKGFLQAVEALIFPDNSFGSPRYSYLQQMRSLYSQFPRHEEVRAFLTIALLSVSAESEFLTRKQLRLEAGNLAMGLMADNNNHPGAIHYTIHSFDDPDNALRALSAADKYVEIAPIIAHARHMPSHIYFYTGDWPKVAELNETAFYTARALWRPGDNPREQNHALEFGQYGDLLAGDFDSAMKWIERSDDTLLQNPESAATIETFHRLQARLIIEARQWQYIPVETSLSDDQLFAAGLSAINMRDLALAIEANQILQDRVNQDGDNVSRRIAQLQLQANIFFYTNQVDAGLEVLDSAIALTLENPRTDPLPSPLKPALELKGELLLKANQPAAAIDAFERSLHATPFRPWSVLGLARSHAVLGNVDQATRHYRFLLSIWNNEHLLGVHEARTYLSGNPHVVSAGERN
jgi:tetratricopeptide (TPR) repeat protein